MNIYQTDHTKKPKIFTLIEERKNVDAKKHLEQNPSEIFLKGWMDDTPLHIASLSGNFEMVQFLVEKGANVNAERSGVYATPLCWADNLEIAKYLLENGATMNDRELYFATRQNKPDVVDLLLSNGAKIDRKEPQYLVCNSIECIKMYLNHHIPIDGSDKNDSNLLHNLAWLDLPEVFDFAHQNGCPWKRDSSRRTPYNLAKQGRRENILKHFKENYTELISVGIENIAIADYEFETVIFLKQSPTNPDCFIGLTRSAKLIKYLLQNGALIIERVASINISYIRNFSFDKNGRIIFPTDDNKLLLIEQDTFQLIDSIELEHNLILNNIEYLPSKKVFLSSSQSGELVMLSENYTVISKSEAENGIMLPKVNQDERLVSFLSYDQETFHDLYKMDDDLKLSYIHTFFKDWDNSSSGFGFLGNEFAVSFPDVLEYYSFEKDELNRLWQIDISQYKSKFDHSDITITGQKIIVVGKGKTLLFINTLAKAITRELQLELLAEIKELYVDENQENLIITTDKELKVIGLK